MYEALTKEKGETKLSLDKKLLAVIEFNFLYWVNLKYKKKRHTPFGTVFDSTVLYRQFSRLERKTDNE